ncbi:uncharacterized protein MYCFIDRAFT_189262 [Pseudocercospora fijiensis CIRAD86]|uniref:Xylanolytic transcriptional activator regulatory domain-containing protein n=1 Tax=Pseudocercospora fijiensis (strain CIRAD86) TaxID=383855 RepID=M3AUT4_PSEFD|nr:uncharacterized protein MYCFIDRAFT_189262 [Pseudocercospora fijiensis CIRAD86]EME80908.1 hypothetical protein MYCFIDRAFT_189262 [Pseudocercospora fijiensis CIRAD86]
MEATESPASTQETGSLTQPSPHHERRFIGSSSGVYFINTVRKAFEVSQQEEPSRLPAAEETVGGEDDFAPSARNSPERGQGFELNINGQRAIEINSSTQLGSLPPYATAQQAIVEYFKTWHPILPFLSGPAFLASMDALYQDPRTAKGSGRISADRQRLCSLIIFQCILAIGTFSLPIALPSQSSLPSKSNLLSLVASLASRHDILTIQTLLAAQVYCVSTLSLRTASTIGGILSKLLFHAGMHRCPYRYPQLSNEDRDLRKRILWSAYSIDRYLCQALGIPVSLSDSEIDVCVSGRREVHGTTPTDLNGVPLPTPSAEPNALGSNSEHANAAGPHADVMDDANRRLEVILANFVEYGRLVGNLMELFHISLHSRKNDPRKILFLRSDVDKWFNSMPSEPTPSYANTGADEQIIRFLPFLHVLYEQLKISIHRPSLSLPRSTPEFHHSLQVTIRAAKRTILAMERQTNLFWPGYVASVWMSGLIISFACQIGMYNTSQGSTEILRCLDLLKRMGERWRSAQRCYAALSTLLSDLQRNQRRISDLQAEDDPFGRQAKRAKLDTPASEAGQTPTSISPTSNAEVSPNGHPVIWRGAEFKI